LELLRNKVDKNPPKKHGNIPLWLADIETNKNGDYCKSPFRFMII
jgi:hypothetical protein